MEWRRMEMERGKWGQNQWWIILICQNIIHRCFSVAALRLVYISWGGPLYTHFSHFSQRQVGPSVVHHSPRAVQAQGSPFIVILPSNFLSFRLYFNIKVFLLQRMISEMIFLAKFFIYSLPFLKRWKITCNFFK